MTSVTAVWKWLLICILKKSGCWRGIYLRTHLMFSSLCTCISFMFLYTSFKFHHSGIFDCFCIIYTVVFCCSTACINWFIWIIYQTRGKRTKELSVCYVWSLEKYLHLSYLQHKLIRSIKMMQSIISIKSLSYILPNDLPTVWNH